MTHADRVSPIAYAIPKPVGGSPLWAGVWIIFGGLGLVFLGGCFCIGILMIVTNTAYGAFQLLPGPPPPPHWAWQNTLLMFVLYAFAFACFGGGAAMLIAGVRKLLTVGRVI